MASRLLKAAQAPLVPSESHVAVAAPRCLCTNPRAALRRGIARVAHGGLGPGLLHGGRSFPSSRCDRPRMGAAGDQRLRLAARRTPAVAAQRRSGAHRTQQRAGRFLHGRNLDRADAFRSAAVGGGRDDAGEDCVAAGGIALLLRGIGVQSLACLLVITTGGFNWAPQTTMAEMLATFPFLVSYPLILSGMTYKLTQRVRQQNRLLARISSIDGLSELLNRAHWEESVDRILSACRNNGGVASLLMIDIDHFKQINDRYGHTVGDEVIGRIGAIIRRNMREGDIAGRYGGDEFGAALNGVDAATAVQIAERIRASIHAAGFEHAAELHCTLSIGIAQSGEGARDARAWVRQADAALYNAKLRGRNQLASNADAWRLDASAA